MVDLIALATVAGEHLFLFGPPGTAKSLLVREFAASPRSGDTVYGFVAGLYPSDFPSLPDPVDESGGTG